MKSPVQMYLRVRFPDGSSPFLKAAFAANGRIRPNHAIHNGRPTLFPDSTYYLRFHRAGGRVWESVGGDASLAIVAFHKKVLALQGGGDPEPSPAAVVPAQTAVTPPSTDKPGKRLLTECATKHIAETADHKSKKTLAAYRLSVEAFVALTTKTLIEDVTREDVLGYAAWLRKGGSSPRTVRNRIDHLQVFFNRFKIERHLKKNDRPQYTRKKVRAYNPGDLAKMFDKATVDELDLLYFFLCTGAREQETQFVCWPDVDLERKTYTVTEHTDLGFRPKDKEEGTVPIPDLLVERLKARRKRYPRSRLIFPGRNGKPNGHALRTVKCLALRAGVNCGDCTNKAGLSCIEHPVCKHVLLHKLRKTFASTLHHNGLPAQTIQRYLRHSELATTVAYSRPA